MIARIFAEVASIWFGTQTVILILALAEEPLTKLPPLVLLLVGLSLSGSAVLAAIAAGSMERR